MKCIEIAAPGAPEQLVLGERPDPTPGPGQVRIKVAAAGVNRPDCLQRRGAYPPPPGASDILGLEVAGEIDQLGEGVAGWAIGDRVCALLTGGGYAELAIADQECLLPVPEPLSFQEAAGLPETVLTVWSTTFQRGGLRAGEALLVHGGSSGIGSTAIQLAKAFDATVATTVGSPEKAAYCQDLGADLIVNYKQDDFLPIIQQQWGGVDVVLDMVGGDYIPKNLQLLKPDGRHVTIAFLGGPKAEINFAMVMLKRLTLTGATLRARDTAFKGALVAQVQQKVWPLLQNGHLRSTIHATFPLSDAAKAHALMESSTHMGKIILTM